MAKKKTSVKQTEPEPSWEYIGNLIGKKFARYEKESPKSCSRFWEMRTIHRHKSHFFGALLFGIILAVILNKQGILLDGIVWWLQVLLVAGFAFMFD